MNSAVRDQYSFLDQRAAARFDPSWLHSPAIRRSSVLAHAIPSSSSPILQVTVMHVDGADLCSESWADEAWDLAEATGQMLAMLLKIRVFTGSGHTAQCCC